jgi:hypothetical protein
LYVCDAKGFVGRDDAQVDEYVRRAHHPPRGGEQGFTNVYLDAIAAVPEDASGDGGEHGAEVAAWQTAVKAAPWLSGESEPQRAVDPDERFDRLKPFQERVAADIRDEPDA